MKIYDFQKNKKIPAPLLDRYLDSNPSFRMKLREIDRGWTLDCSKYIPEDMMVYQHTSVKHMHPIEKIYYSLSNGRAEEFSNIRLPDENFWIYCGEEEYRPINENYSWIFNQLDSIFRVKGFPCWIPDNIEEMLLSSIALFYEYNDLEFNINNDENHHYKVSMMIDYEIKSKVRLPDYYHMMIKDSERVPIITGGGDTPLIATYDLYEKVWEAHWKRFAPSFTQLEGVMDIKGNLILIRRDSIVNNKILLNYFISRTKEFDDVTFYRGKYKFVEGEFEIFVQPLIMPDKSVDFPYYMKNIESISKLIKFIKNKEE